MALFLVSSTLSISMSQKEISVPDRQRMLFAKFMYVNYLVTLEKFE